MTDNKHVTTIDEYISTFPGEIQAALEQMRQAIHHAVPEAAETMSYGMPTFDLNGKHLVFFAGWKHHISLHPVKMGSLQMSLPKQSGQAFRRGDAQWHSEWPHCAK